jgi:hypothetical protein
VPLVNLPPYAIQLRKALGHSIPDLDEHPIGTPDDIDLLSSPDLFPITFTHRFCVKHQDITNEFDTLGFILKEDTQLQRCFISDIKARSTAATYSRWRSTLIGAFILAVDDDIVFGYHDTTAALSRVLVDSSSSTTPTHVTITFAHDRNLICNHLDPDPGIASPIQLDQICHISQIFETGEEIVYQPRLNMEWFQYFENLTNDLACDDGSTAIQYISEASSDDKSHPSIQKTSTTQFTRRQLKLRDDFNEWLEAEYRQLDTHESDGMFGEPCPRPRNAIVLRSIWTYILKKDGNQKSS